MTVLVMTQALDPTADTVILGLAARGVPVFRFDRSWFPQRMSLEAELTSHGWAGRLSSETRSIDLQGIRSVWMRWKSGFLFSPDLSESDRKHANIEAQAGFDGVLAGLNARYVNHPSAVATLTKPAELRLARECGFAVPATVITNVPKRVLGAAKSGPIVRKLFSCHVPGPDGISSIGHSRIPTDRDLSEVDAVSLTAHQVQQYIDKDRDVRVVVVGTRIFPVAIFPESDAARVDFRSDYRSLRYEMVSIPADVEAAIREFMRRAGLLMASFDLVVDRAGHHYFLESNPVGGQYSWLEGETGAPVTEAMVELLSCELGVHVA